MKKIAIIGTVGLPANYGGFETLTEYLTIKLSEKFDMTVYCSSRSYNGKLKMYNGARLEYIPLNANGIQSIVYDIVSIFKALLYADTLLILGVSGCIVLPLVRVFTKKNVVVNIDGLEWKRAKWGKAAKWFLKYSEKLAVKHADVIVADNKVIQDYVKSTYGRKAELIAYGADHTNKEDLGKDVLMKYPFLTKEYAFKVCRIEPENNVHLILEAFSDFKNLNIVIVGNWSNSDYGKQLKLKFDSFENINLLDPIYNQNTLNQLRSNCYLYMHGHSAGGTNPSLVEAMFLELPILAYRVNYNLETTGNKARYFKNKSDLISLLNNLEKEELLTISEDMKQIAHSNYKWKIIADRYNSLF